MNIETLLLFSATVFLLAFTPGQGVWLTVARTLGGGFKHGCVTIAGIITGDLIFIIVVIYGLSYIAETMSTVFLWIKYLGGAYLIWLGISLLHNAFTQKVISEDDLATQQSTKSSYCNDFIAGIIITLSNPKAIAFYLSFLPAFVDIPSLTIYDILLITIIISVMISAAMLFYAIGALKTKHLIGGKTSQKWTQGVAGSLMVATGGVLIAKS